MTTREQKAVARAELTIGRKLGIGGDAWAVTRPAGDGITADASPASVGTWAGYVVEDEPARLAGAMPDVTVGAKPWYAVGQAAALTPSSQLTAGDVLTSQADSAIRFAVVSPDLVVGYVRYLVRPL